MKGFRIMAALAVILIIASCQKPGPSPEELEKIGQLKGELEKIQKEITEAEQKEANLAGGLVKAFVDARIEILKTNEALISQRIKVLEMGGKITIESTGTMPDQEEASRLEQEIEKQEEQIRLECEDAEKFSHGLIAAVKHATVATQEQTLAMLRQKYLIAKYGLPVPKLPKEVDMAQSREASASHEVKDESTDVLSPEKIANEILSVKILRKRYVKQDYEDFIFFDIEFHAIGLDKPSRAIKGILNIQDLFGEAKLRIGYTIDDPISPGGKIVEKGGGIDYNQFEQSHHWVRATELKDMTASFTVNSILYKDGTRRDL